MGNSGFGIDPTPDQKKSLRIYTLGPSGRNNVLGVQGNSDRWLAVRLPERVAKQTPKREPLLRRFKGSGKLRRRDSEDNWLPVEFLTYHDEQANCDLSPTYGREDGGNMPDAHCYFMNELGERFFRWRKWNRKWQEEKSA
jgi:hypothetical protein